MYNSYCKRCGGTQFKWGVIKMETATYDECAECGHRNLRRTFETEAAFNKREALERSKFESPHELRVRDSDLKSGGTMLVSFPDTRMATQTLPSKSDPQH